MNKTAIVTGASRGIGRAAAEELAENGYNVVICCRSSAGELAETEKYINNMNKGRCASIMCDVGSYEDAQRLAEFALERFGRIDVLVNNAGISHVGLLNLMSPEEWDRVIRTNLTGAFNVTRNVLPHMISRKSGAIVNVSSVWGCVGGSMEAAYSASKGGINALTQALAKEVAPSGISVNAVAFGFIDTVMNSNLTEEEKAALMEEIPAGRAGTPREAARIIRSIAEAGTYLTGQIIKADGGWT